jgi:predicted HTH transcriptional regulator
MGTVDPRALLIRLLQEKGEQEWLEFKHNNDDPTMIGQCASACANAAILAGRDRAFIVWGIQDKTKKQLGTSVRLQQLKKGNQGFSSWLTQLLEPRIFMEFIDFEYKGKNFSILTIDHAYDRPVRFSGIEYIRVGDSVKPLKDFTEHERAIWLATGRHRFESAIALPNQTARQVLSLIDADSYYAISKERKPGNDEEKIKRLMMLDYIREDWEGGYNITNLGAILFARDIQLFASIASKSVRVVRYIGRDKTKSSGEIEGQKGYAIGFQGLVKYVMDALPKEEKYVGGARSVVSSYSAISIREVVANALIHQDFTISGAGPLIEIYEDRVEIINPGNSLIKVDRMIDERRSRNEKIAKSMRDLGFCEERGGGIDKAIIDIEERFLPAPYFLASSDAMRIVLFGPKPFRDLSKSDRIWACFCHCVVKWIRHDFMSNTSLRERFSLTDEEYQVVSGVIAEAKREHRIKAADANQGKRNAKYIPYWAD